MIIIQGQRPTVDKVIEHLREQWHVEIKSDEPTNSMGEFRVIVWLYRKDGWYTQQRQS